jgi:hypothetical protein
MLFGLFSDNAEEHTRINWAISDQLSWKTRNFNRHDMEEFFFVFGLGARWEHKHVPHHAHNDENSREELGLTHAKTRGTEMKLKIRGKTWWWFYVGSLREVFQPKFCDDFLSLSPAEHHRRRKISFLSPQQNEKLCLALDVFHMSRTLRD